jgi:hypothetical protein
VIELFVGEDKLLFRVHKEVLCQVDVFSKMFNSGFEEASSGLAHLPEDDPSTFKSFLEWIYLDDSNVLSEKGSVMQRIELYCLASKYGATALMDRPMDSIHTSIGEMRELLNESAMDYVYKNFAGECGLKRFIAEFLVYAILDHHEERFHLQGGAHIDTEELVKLTQDHADLHFAVFEILRCSNGHIMPTPDDLSLKRSNCKWHEHLYNGSCPLRDQYPEDKNNDLFHYF